MKGGSAAAQLNPLLDDEILSWDEHTDSSSGKKYYVHKESSVTKWEPMSAAKSSNLPGGWKVTMTLAVEGNTTSTKRAAKWEHPREG